MKALTNTELELVCGGGAIVDLNLVRKEGQSGGGYQAPTDPATGDGNIQQNNPHPEVTTP